MNNDQGQAVEIAIDKLLDSADFLLGWLPQHSALMAQLSVLVNRAFSLTVQHRDGRTVRHDKKTQLALFGSAASGFGNLKFCDIDITVLADSLRHNEASALRRLSNIFRPLGLVCVKRVLGAAVPVITLEGSFQNVPVSLDVSINNSLAVLNSQLLREYSLCDPRVRPFVMLIKSWAKLHDIADAPRGYLSSYSFTLLAIYFLQIQGVVPNLQGKEITTAHGVEHTVVHFGRRVRVVFAPAADVLRNDHLFKQQNEMSVGKLYHEFFCFFGNKRSLWKNIVISIREPMLNLSRQKVWGKKGAAWKLSIADPFDLERDLGCTIRSKACSQEIMEEFRMHKDRLDAVARGKPWEGWEYHCVDLLESNEEEEEEEEEQREPQQPEQYQQQFPAMGVAAKIVSLPWNGVKAPGADMVKMAWDVQAAGSDSSEARGKVLSQPQQLDQMEPEHAKQSEARISGSQLIQAQQQQQPQLLQQQQQPPQQQPPQQQSPQQQGLSHLQQQAWENQQLQHKQQRQGQQRHIDADHHLSAETGLGRKLVSDLHCWQLDQDRLLALNQARERYSFHATNIQTHFETLQHRALQITEDSTQQAYLAHLQQQLEQNKNQLQQQYQTEHLQIEQRFQHSKQQMQEPQATPLAPRLSNDSREQRSGFPGIQPDAAQSAQPKQHHGMRAAFQATVTDNSQPLQHPAKQLIASELSGFGQPQQQQQAGHPSPRTQQLSEVLKEVAVHQPQVQDGGAHQSQNQRRPRGEIPAADLMMPLQAKREPLEQPQASDLGHEFQPSPVRSASKRLIIKQPKWSVDRVRKQPQLTKKQLVDEMQRVAPAEWLEENGLSGVVHGSRNALKRCSIDSLIDKFEKLCGHCDAPPAASVAEHSASTRMAKAEDDPQQDSGAPEGPWTCATCTFINEDAITLACAMCGTERVCA